MCFEWINRSSAVGDCEVFYVKKSHFSQTNHSKSIINTLSEKMLLLLVLKQLVYAVTCVLKFVRYFVHKNTS